MIEVKDRESGGGSNGRQLAIARSWCKGADISHEDVTWATSYTMFGRSGHTQGPGRSLDGYGPAFSLRRVQGRPCCGAVDCRRERRHQRVPGQGRSAGRFGK